MHWWGKSSKETERKARKGSVVNTFLEKVRIVSGGRSPRSVTSRKNCTDTVSQNAHPRATHLVDSGIGRSMREGHERGFQPSLLNSFIEPETIVYTPDGKYIDMEFMTASAPNSNSSRCDNSTQRHLVTDQVSSYKTNRKTETNCPSRSVRSREIMRPSNSLLNSQSVSLSAPNSTISSPLVTPRRVIRDDPLKSYGFGSGKSHASTSQLGSRHDSFQTDHIIRKSSVKEDAAELINRPHNRCKPECSPTISPRKDRRYCSECSPTLSPKMPSAHNNSRVNSAAVTPFHQHAAGACPERSKFWSDDRNRQGYKLPLPPVTTSSPVPMSPSYSTSPNSHVLKSSVQANNLPSQRWKKGRLIGCGTYGQVYIGFNCESGKICAMKEVTIYSDDPKSKECARQLSQEIALLSQIHHPNIVQYYGSEMVEDNMYIYLEYVSGGSIHKVIHDFGPLGETALRSFTQQILSGLEYLHAKNTAHRDVKGANILLQNDGIVKLADFGMAKHINGESGRMSFKGSPYWIAPEVVRNSTANVSVDIWSLGCTVLEMATGKPPWGQHEEVAAIFKIGHSKELPTIPDSLSEEGKDFIRKCLQRDPLQRPTAAQLLEHPFVKSATPSKIHVSSPEPVEATRLATITGNLQIRNQQFLDPGALRQSRCSRTMTPISTTHSPKNRTCPVSPIGNVLPHSQSPQYTRVTPPSLTPHSSSGSSMLDGVDVGAILFRHPRTPPHVSERLSPSSGATPRGTRSSVPIAPGNVRPCRHPGSSKHRCDCGKRVGDSHV